MESFTRTAAWLGLLCVAVCAHGSVAAQAPAEDLSWLDWHAPSGCPDAAWVHDRIRHVRADRPLASHGWQVAVNVEVDPADTWHLRMIVTAPMFSERTLEGPSCTEVSEGAALLLALLLEAPAVDEEDSAAAEVASPDPPADDALTLHPSDAPPPAAPARPDGSQSVVFLPEPTQPEPVTETAPRPSALPDPRGKTFDVGAFVVGDVATLPGPTGGFAAQLGLELHRVWLGTAVMYLLPSIARAAALPEARTRIDLWTVETQVCGSLPVGVQSRGRQGPCIGIESGRMRAEEIGLLGGGFGSTPWVALKLGVRGGLVLPSHWGVFGFMGLAVPLLRNGFSSGTGSDEVLVHRSSAVVLRVSLGFAWLQS